MRKAKKRARKNREMARKAPQPQREPESTQDVNDMVDRIAESAGEILKDYRIIRAKLAAINDSIFNLVTPDMMRRSGSELGILHGDVFILDSEDVMAVLMDYSIYANPLQRRKLIDDYREKYKRSLDKDDLELLRAMEEASYMLIQCKRVVSGLGAHVVDLLTGHEFFIIDVGFSMSLEPYWVMATNVIAPYGIPMTTGAALPLFDSKAIQEIEKILRSYAPPHGGIIDSSQDRGLFAARIIRTLLKYDVMEYVRFK